MGFLRRYKSTIYGNYKRASLQYGAIVGAVMAAYMLICSLVGQPLRTPENYGTDALLLLGIFYFSYRYRRNLPEGKITLKELMMLGLGIGIVSGVVYGLIMYLLMKGFCPQWVEQFQEARVALMSEGEIDEITGRNILQVQQYGAGDWAFIGGFRSFVMSVIIALFSAIIFTNEKSAVVHKQKQKNN